MLNQVSEFRKTRELLDPILNYIATIIEAMKYQEAEQKLQDVNELYERLEQLAGRGRQVQLRVLQNRADRIQALDTQIQDGLARREAGKREDGNLAFKCNWNDALYKGICSDKVYLTNRRSLRSECARSNCRKYVGRTPAINECCYECHALLNYRFGAGWDHDKVGKAVRPRQIWHARKGKIALLTTIPPWTSETLVVGAFQIRDVSDDRGRETYIYGASETALDDMLDYSIPLWRFHQNPVKPESKAWGQGLFRYVSDVAALGMLEAYREGKRASSGDTARVEALISELKSQRK